MPMKVTVCFDRVRVIVPCGTGDLPVSDLINKAIIRYRKAIGKSNDHWVTVHNLKTSNDGGILDPDDTLIDVVDDREQLIAEYEEQGGHVYQPHNGDGASASSAGTASPDMFQASENSHVPYPKDVHGYLPDGDHDIVVTPKDLSHGPLLTVRHGSEPMLNISDDGGSPQPEQKPVLSVKPEKDERKPVGIVHAKQASCDDGRSKSNLGNKFARDSWRQSLGNRPEMYKWLEAQERQQEKHIYSKVEVIERRDPVGGVSSEQGKEIDTSKRHVPKILHPGEVTLVLPNDGGPLGIHVVPDFGESGNKEIGLLVQGVEEGGRVYKDGRLQANDRIVEINGTRLEGVSFSKAQEIFRAAMKEKEIKLQVMKKKAPPLPKNPPPVLPKPKAHVPVKPSPLTLPSPKLSPVPMSPLSPDQTSTPVSAKSTASSVLLDITSPIGKFGGDGLRDNDDDEEDSSRRSSVTDSEGKKPPPLPPARNPTTGLSTSAPTAESKTKLINLTNTKKIGKKICIELTKGPQGLGFSVTSRDNPSGGDSPIYIKNILPKGAAIIDGRLKAGDRLLEINEKDMTGKTQSEVVNELRNLKLGALVKLLVSRQEIVDERFTVPRELKQHVSDEQEQNQTILQPTEKSGDDDGQLSDMRNKEVLKFEVALNDSGSAGLGVSVKGKTQTTDEGQRDLGIFIKAVIHGGAASKDGRLIVNDQLLEVNGEKLTGMSNTAAMETLRKAMQKVTPIDGYIPVTIARRIGAPSPSPYQEKCLDYLFLNKHPEDSETMPPEHQERLHVVPDKKKDQVDSKARNFLIDRLTSGGNGLHNDSYAKATHDSFVDGLRNESYTRATHEGFNNSAMFQGATSPTLLPPVNPQIMLEDDSRAPRMRPHSTLGVFRGSPTHSTSSSSEDLHQQPPWLQGPDWNRHASTTSEELSPLDPPDSFQRDAAGRQSMSEKRKGHLDPRGSEFYQKVKTLRDSQQDLQNKRVNRRSSSFQISPGQQARHRGLVRAGSAESLINKPKPAARQKPRVPLKPSQGAFNPPRGMPITNLKRFSSLENLAATGSEVNNDSRDTEDSNERTSVQDDTTQMTSKVLRGRGCNESFRAAVDRSYDVTAENNMDTLDEESSESGSFGAERGPTHSTKSSISSTTELASIEDQSKRRARHKSKERKTTADILKGFFKKGKSKKSKAEKDKEEEDEERAFLERSHDSQSSQEQERRFAEGPFMLDQNQLNRYGIPQQYPDPSPFPYTQEENQKSKPSTGMSRAEWIQHLRMEHQRKHRERQGQYPLDDREEQYEKEIQDDELKVPFLEQYRSTSRYGRTNFDPSRQQRPSSRQQYGYEMSSAPPEPHSYGNYAFQSAPPDVQTRQPYHHQTHHEYPPLHQVFPLQSQHTRQPSDSYSRPDLYSEHNHFVSRPQTVRSHTPIESWRDNQFSYQTKPSYNSSGIAPQNGSFYPNTIFSYREPVHPALSGKRPVHNITQPGSAKV